MKGLICVLIILICVQYFPVEGKNRNRVQKWQQRTWRTRFGSAPKSDWKFDVPPGKSKSHRRNLYASSHYGGLNRNDHHIPNGYSNFHYRLNDAKSVPISYGSVRRGHRNGKKKDITLNENGIQNYRMKRFAIGDEDEDDEPEQFPNDLVDAPFVFDSDIELKDEDQGFNSDLVDIDFVRDGDEESSDFIPIQPGPNQRYITVEENDPFPHAAPPPSPAAPPSSTIAKKNATRKVQYTLIIHHGQETGGSTDLHGGRGPFLWLTLALAGWCTLPGLFWIRV